MKVWHVALYERYEGVIADELFDSLEKAMAWAEARNGHPLVWQYWADGDRPFYEAASGSKYEDYQIVHREVK